jgi:ABC-type polysaccharide/polyol phosphate export permease
LGSARTQNWTRGFAPPSVGTGAPALAAEDARFGTSATVKLEYGMQPSRAACPRCKDWDLSDGAYTLRSPRAARPGNKWAGDYLFLVQNLVLKDFKIRYRNMSLGMFWSILNPLVMMSVLWFVFTKIYANQIPNFAVFVMCGIVPFNVFTISWLGGTTSLVDSAGLIKRVPVPREIIPIASVLSTCVHLSFQIALLLLLVVATGQGINRYWLWLLVIWPLEIIFVTGISLISSSLNIYIRDIRYVVESANVVLFWLVPIFYTFSRIPPQYREIYQFNPVAAMVLASRNILLEGAAPPASLLIKLACSSILMLLAGILIFRRLQARFYDYL